MANNFARPGTQKAVPIAEAKAKVLEAIRNGAKVNEACHAVGRSPETYRDWMKTDRAFKAAVQDVRTVKKVEDETGTMPVPDFPEFCATWLKQPLFPHQMRMLDVIEGNAPRDLHPSMDYLPGYNRRVLINVPPEHAKSTTFTINYTVWLIHKNPDVRVVIMSQGKTLAQRMLYEIKLKLTSPLFREMHTRFAPVGDDGVRGWRDPDNSWTTDAIYVKGKGSTVDGVGKDPTVQALGLGGQIYGTRADVIFLDDVITTKNAREIDKQVILLDREIESRLPSDQEGGGLLAILGTRVAPQDLYRHLLDVTDHDDERVWTYFRQPAVLDYGDGDSASWLTLWPEKWNGKSLARRKRSNAWNLVYQQLNVDDEMTFKAEAVEASINRARFPGLISPTNTGHQRPEGMGGLYVAAGIDPATVGCTAIIVAGLDRETGKRYVIDGWNKLGATSSQIIEQIKYLTDVYPIQEWVVEKNAFQRFLAQLPEVVNYLRARGARVHEHGTTANKFDEDWGIQTMAPLFESCGIPDERAVSGRWKRTPKNALMELPCERQNTWVNELIQQLTTWQPSGNSQKARFDLVMALWFTHIAFDKLLRRSIKRQTHLSSPFLSPAARSRQQVISLADMRRQKQEAIA